MKPSQLFSHWQKVRTGLLATIEQFSEEELGHIPFNGSWTVGQIMLHIADCEDNWLHGVVREEFRPWISYDLTDYPTKGDIVALLDRARQRTVHFLNGLEEGDLDREYRIPSGHPFSLGWIIWHVLEHEIHHRGELSLILGMLGREGLDV